MVLAVKFNVPNLASPNHQGSTEKNDHLEGRTITMGKGFDPDKFDDGEKSTIAVLCSILGIKRRHITFIALAFLAVVIRWWNAYALPHLAAAYTQVLEELDDNAHSDSWTDNEHAPLPAQEFHIKHMAWFPILALLIIGSVRGIKHGSPIVAKTIAAVFMCYNLYIVFDHSPFLVTSVLYKSARINYENLSLSLFWGMEASSMIVAHKAVGAPKIVLGNMPNHLYFIVANYAFSVATGLAFVAAKKRHSVWVVGGVGYDLGMHLVCVWCYLRFLTKSKKSAVVWWVVLNAAMIVLTCIVHGDVMSWGHLMFYIYG